MVINVSLKFSFFSAFSPGALVYFRIMFSFLHHPFVMYPAHWNRSESPMQAFWYPSLHVRSVTVLLSKCECPEESASMYAEERYFLYFVLPCK